MYSGSRCGRDLSVAEVIRNPETRLGIVLVLIPASDCVPPPQKKKHPIPTPYCASFAFAHTGTFQVSSGGPLNLILTAGQQLGGDVRNLRGLQKPW